MPTHPRPSSSAPSSERVFLSQNIHGPQDKAHFVFTDAELRYYSNSSPSVCLSWPRVMLAVFGKKTIVRLLPAIRVQAPSALAYVIPTPLRLIATIPIPWDSGALLDDSVLARLSWISLSSYTAHKATLIFSYPSYLQSGLGQLGYLFPDPCCVTLNRPPNFSELNMIPVTAYSSGSGIVNASLELTQPLLQSGGLPTPKRGVANIILIKRGSSIPV